MMNTPLKLTLALVAAVCGGPSLAAGASAVEEGKQLYSQYRCADCHGLDGRAVPAANVTPLAGMNPDHVYLKTKRFLETRAHDNVIAGCGEPPSSIQIKKISDYLATLPR